MPVRLDRPPAPIGHVQAAGGQVEERVTQTRVHLRQLRQMPVATEKDDAGGLGVAENLEQPLPLGREVHPLLERVVLGDDLDARANQPHVGRQP